MVRLRNVTFMTTDPERLADFWARALGFGGRRSSPEEVLIADEGWPFPRFTFQRVRERRAVPGPVHIDLTADDRASEVARLVALGAVEGRTHGDEAFSWTVMQDPDGNEFCVTDA